MAGNDVFLFPSALPGANDVELNAEPSGGATPLALAATDGADTAAFAFEADSTPMALAATDGADTAAATVNVTASLAATDGADSAAATVNVTAALAATDGADSAAASVNATASLAATDGADSAAATVTADCSLQATDGADDAAMAFEEEVANGLALAATEGADTAEALLEAVAVEIPSAGGGVTRRRREKPISARKLMSYEDTIILERLEAVVEAVKKDPEALEGWQDALAHEIGALRTVLVHLKADAERRREQDLVAQAVAEAEKLLKRQKAAARRQQEDDDTVIALFAMALSSNPFATEEET